MNGGTDEREILTWEGFGVAARQLAQQIADSGFDPEIVIAIARGGMIPAGALSYALGIKPSGCINVEFYVDIAKTLPDPVLLAPKLDTAAISGKRLLVVDDVVDSGRTMALVCKLLRGFGTQLRSAVLYAKPSTVIRPDFVWCDTDRWINFPWSSQPPVRSGGYGADA